MRNPRSVLALNALSGVLMDLGAKELASSFLEIALKISPDDPLFLVTLAELYREKLEYKQAIELFRKAIEKDPTIQEASLGLALSLQSIGQLGEAAQVLEGMVKRRQSSIDSLFALAQVPKSVAEVDLLAAIDNQVRHDSEDPEEFRNLRLFVRAIALDRLGRYDDAWAALLKANDEIDAKFQNEKQALRKQDLEFEKWIEISRKRIPLLDSKDHPVSLLILGPSRSGKTSVEAALSKIAGVGRGYESGIVDRATRAAYQSAGLIDTFPLWHLPQSCNATFREAYFAELQAREPDAKVVTNTSPSNVRNVTSLLSIVPNVRVVFLKRDPEDILLRIFMYKYKAGNAYAYDVKSIQEHVLWYYRIMDRIAEQHETHVKVFNYEDFVASWADSVRTIAAWCGLEMQPDLDFAFGDDRGCAAPYRDMIRKKLA